MREGTAIVVMSVCFVQLFAHNMKKIHREVCKSDVKAQRLQGRCCLLVFYTLWYTPIEGSEDEVVLR